MYSKAELLAGIPPPPPVTVPKKKILAPVRFVRGATFHSRPRRHRAMPKSKSGLYGVIHCPQLPNKQWKAYVTDAGKMLDGKYVKGRCITIGYFATKEEAAEAYNRKAREIHGDKAVLNTLP